MTNRDCKTRKMMPFPSGETTARDLGFRHLLETDRMRLPDETFGAIEQLLRELSWLVQMAKAERVKPE